MIDWELRRVGDLEVFALSDAVGPFFEPTDVAFSNASRHDWAGARHIDPRAFGPGGEWILTFRSYAIRHPNGDLVLVDTGIGDRGSPAADWAPVPGTLLHTMAEAELEPADVDAVVLTHLHSDHVGWAVHNGHPTFPNARYLVQNAEIEALPTNRHAVAVDVVEPLLREGCIEPVDGDSRLSGDWSGRGTVVRLLSTPGHTPGHQSVEVASSNERVVITGDLLVHAVQLVNPRVHYRHDMDHAQAERSRRSMIDFQGDRPTYLATAHLSEAFVRSPSPPR